MLTQILTKNLDIVFFIYGLAFFVMGTSILAQPGSVRRDSIFELASTIWILAGFGITHGLNEWLDMAGIVRGYNSDIWNFTRVLVLTLSFVFLFEFGRRLILLSFKDLKPLKKRGTLALTILVAALIFIPHQDRTIWPRYLLALPGGILTAFGLILYYRGNKTILKPLGFRRHFLMAAFSMGVYSVLAGLVVPKANFFPASVINNASFLNLTGIPVQVFRAVCAVVLSWSIRNIFSLFDMEFKAKMKNRLEETVAAKAFADTIINSMPCALIAVDPDMKIKLINKTACELLGYACEELSGKHLRQIFEEEKAPLMSSLFKTIKESGYIRNYETTYLSKYRMKIPVLFSTAVVRNAEGEISEFICVAKDVAELKDLQEKLVRAEKLTAMGKFASIIGHEFRNQLGAMGISIYFLKMKLRNEDEKIKRHVENLEEQLNETNRIIENILAFSKARKPELKDLDLKAVLSNSVGKFRISGRMKIITDIAEGLPKIRGDELQLSRVFVNIISNALEAMDEKGILTVTAAMTRDLVGIAFKDTGPGIKEEDKNKLFEPFFSTKVHGTGLGLPICRDIMEAHKGSIKIESEQGKGTTVIVRLPTGGQ